MGQGQQPVTPPDAPSPSPSSSLAPRTGSHCEGSSSPHLAPGGQGCGREPGPRLGQTSWARLGQLLPDAEGLALKAEVRNLSPRQNTNTVGE